MELVFERKVGENEHLFGSVTSGDIAHQLEEKGYTIDRRKISLEEPLEDLGEYHVPVKLHREVTSPRQGHRQGRSAGRGDCLGVVPKHSERGAPPAVWVRLSPFTAIRLVVRCGRC